jgi:hypothetical protein
MRVHAIAALTLLVFVSSDKVFALDFAKDCADILKADVTVRDELRPNEPMNVARGRLQLMASQSALRQTIGEKVSANSSYELRSQNMKIEERLFNRIRAQATGFVKQQDIIEKVEKEGGREILVIQSKASVCLPKPSVIVKETVQITSTVNVQGAELLELRISLGDVFSSSQAFAVVESEDDMPDYQISGKIERIEWDDVSKTVKPDFLAAGKNAASSSDYQRLSVGIWLQARRADGSVVTSNVSQFRNFPISADPNLVSAPYVREVLQLAARDLREKITRLRHDAAKIQTAPSPLTPKKEW